MDCCADISYIVASHRHCCYIDIAGDTANIIRAGNRTGVITSKNFRIVLIITNDTANLLCGFISDCSGIAAVVNVAIRVRSIPYLAILQSGELKNSILGAVSKEEVEQALASAGL